jgi:hypothetical protein
MLQVRIQITMLYMFLTSQTSPTNIYTIHLSVSLKILNSAGDYETKLFFNNAETSCP